MNHEEQHTKLAKKIRNCRKCELWKTRKNVVVGAGPLDTKVMFIGEAPGREEDEQGKPFVGRAGELLTESLANIGLKRGDIYITNILKCRPPENRNPRSEEIQQCLPYLLEQINLVNPEIITTLGKVSTQVILKRRNIQIQRISKVRGKIFQLKDHVVLPTYHPAAALYNPSLKEKIEEDFQKLESLISKEDVKKQNVLDSFLDSK